MGQNTIKQEEKAAQPEGRKASKTSYTQDRAWTSWAIGVIEADFTRSADTHLLKIDLPAWPSTTLYLKDESTHPTGSLKHRLARSLFLYALCNGWIRRGTPVIEASSGSTAVSEAYFARLLDLPFYAVMPAQTAKAKVEQITFYGGKPHLVDDPCTVRATAQNLAQELDGCFLDQFTFAERATDWRGNNNIAQSLFAQLAAEPNPIPDWIICGAGTGGTSATLGRYARYQQYPTRLCVVDPENSAFFANYRHQQRDLTVDQGSRIEGIGRPVCEPSFIPELVDEMIKIPDVASIAACRYISQILGKSCGGSTGTNIIGAMALIARLAREKRPHEKQISVVSLLCDGGERYRHSYFDDAWLQRHKLDIKPWYDRVAAFFEDGRWHDEGLEFAVPSL